MKIELKNISKSFGSLKANKEISISISGGIHALLGENGAGKSTLVKIISGQLNPDKGSILISDKKINLGSPKIAINNGIGMLNQNPLDFANLSVLESFLVGNTQNSFMSNNHKTKEEILHLFDNYNIEIDLNEKISSFSIGQRQQIELLRLLYNGVKIIILDEPTSAFSLEQKKMIFDTLKKLTKEDITIIFVSHKLDEVFEICDSGTVLKSGRVVYSIHKPFVSDYIFAKMFDDTRTKNKITNKEKRSDKFKLFIDELDKTKQETFSNESLIDFGTVVGIAGLQGSMNDKLVNNFFSRDFSKTGIFFDNGDYIDKEKLYYMPADRLERGLFEDLTLKEHFALSYSNRSKYLNWNDIEIYGEKKIQEYDIKATITQKVDQLSGGNQQRLMLSLLPESPGVLLLEQPTRGLDFNSANKMWDIILHRKKNDIAIIFSSTDLEEIWDYSDIIISVSGNTIVNIESKQNLNKENLARYVSGILD